MTIYLRKGGSTYHLRKRVPLRFKNVEPREIVAMSLHTDSRTMAQRKAAEVWAHMIEGWEAALRLDANGARIRYEAAKEVADRRGFSYMAAPAIANLPLDDILSRVKAIPRNKDGSPNQRIGDAVLGGVEERGITINEALDEYWKVAADKVRGKTPDQLRRWKHPRTRAIKNLVSVVGDKPLSDVTRTDMKLFRDWWNTRIDNEGLTSNAANKDFQHIAAILRAVDDALGLELNLPVSRLAINGTKRRRLPFSDKWIRAKLLAKGALDGLNDEARCILLVCINTGARPSEIAGLMKRHVHLDGKVPFISIEPEGRQLKNAASQRRIPLVGVSLKALKEYMPKADNGDRAFPRYFGKDALSAVLNKFLRENGLLETSDHTLYGLRHSMEDRMTAAEPAWPERMKCDVFGHALGRQRYGEGASLEHIHRRMLEIAL